MKRYCQNNCKCLSGWYAASSFRSDPGYSISRLMTREEQVVVNPPELTVSSMWFLPPSAVWFSEGGLRSNGP